MLTTERGTEATRATAKLSSMATEPGPLADPSLRRRLIDAWSCSPDSESDLPKLRTLLRMALGVVLLFVKVPIMYKLFPPSPIR